MHPYREAAARDESTPPGERWRRLRVIEANHGRSEGWYVEWRGVRVAELTDYQWADMFWVSYALTPTTAEPSLLAPIGDDAWWQRCEPRFQTRTTGFWAPHAFSSHAPRDGRVTVRGLYVSLDLTWAERIHLLARRVRRAMAAF